MSESRKGALACITMDVEPDFVSYSVSSNCPRYYGLFDEPGYFERFCNTITRHQVRLTCYVVGSVLRDRADYVRELAKIGAEFGCHSLTHDLAAQETESEVRGGIDGFTDFFGYSPQGYRSPFFILRPITLETLDRQGVRYDSSFMPSIRPGLYSSLNGQMLPFRWQGFSLVELPLAVVPRVRVPIALSYMKALGKTTYSILRRVSDFPDPLVTFFHPMNLIYSPAAYERLPLRWKLANARNRWRGLEMLEQFLTFIEDSGYQFAFMSEVYEHFLNTPQPIVPLH